MNENLRKRLLETEVGDRLVGAELRGEAMAYASVLDLIDTMMRENDIVPSR
jgi:hypothetical protein